MKNRTYLTFLRPLPLVRQSIHIYDWILKLRGLFRWRFSILLQSVTVWLRSYVPDKGRHFLTWDTQPFDLLVSIKGHYFIVQRKWKSLLKAFCWSSSCTVFHKNWLFIYTMACPNMIEVLLKLWHWLYAWHWSSGDSVLKLLRLRGILMLLQRRKIDFLYDFFIFAIHAQPICRVLSRLTELL